MAKQYKPLPTPEKLWDLFALNPLTGKLFWRSNPSNSCAPDGLVGHTDKRGYIQLSIKRQKYLAHRIIRAWVDGKDPGETELDHADRNKCNNQPWNIRACTYSQNQVNVTHVKGYCRQIIGKKVKYVTRIMVNKQSIFLGHFGTAEEARTCYIEAKRRLFGEFAP
jgi:hypothetical protein